MYKCINGIVPSYLLSEFRHSHQLQSHFTRRCDQLRLLLAKTTKYQGSFQINSARAYNSSPHANVRTVKDFNEFIVPSETVFQTLAWFESYLELSKYYVYVEGGKSSVRSLTCGVPQGSVLGPILYVLNTTPVADIIKAHKVEYHYYADDTQLYVTFKCDSLEDVYLDD